MTLLEQARCRLLVTGGSGFIGTNLMSYCRRAGMSACNLDIAPPRDRSQRELWQRGNVLDPQAIDDAVGAFDPTHVVHLAARTDLHGKTVRDYPANISGVENVVNTLRRAHSVERVVFASSRMVCDIAHTPRADDDYCPPNAYGESKVLTEKTVRASALEIPWTIIRPTSIWGPWFQTPYREFFEMVRRRRFVEVRDHQVWKSFGYVENTVDIIVRLLAAPVERVGGQTVYVSDYEPIDVGAMARTIAREFGVAPPRSVPKWPLGIAALGGDALQRIGWDEPPLTRFRLRNLLSNMVFDSSPLRDMIGGQLPYATGEGITRTVAWMKSQERRPNVPQP